MKKEGIIQPSNMRTGTIIYEDGKESITGDSKELTDDIGKNS